MQITFQKHTRFITQCKLLYTQLRWNNTSNSARVLCFCQNSQKRNSLGFFKKVIQLHQLITCIKQSSILMVVKTKFYLQIELPIQHDQIFTGFTVSGIKKKLGDDNGKGMFDQLQDENWYLQ